MTNPKDTTNQGSSAEGQQPRNENVTSDVTGAAPTGPPHPPAPPSTGQVNVGGGFGGFAVGGSSGSPPVRTPLTTGQFNVGGGFGGFATGGSSVTPSGPNRGPPCRGSLSPSRRTSTPRRGSPSGGRRTPGRGSPSGGKSPPSGRGSPSSLGRGSSSTSPSAEGNITQIGGSSFTPVSVEISLGGGLAAAGSMAEGGQPGKRKAEVNAPEGMTPTCSVCKRSDFSSWKALFGHLRSHPERRYRGAFPPPGQQQGEASTAANVRGFDLNEASDVEEDNEGGGGFDLNMPAADDDDVTDDNMDGGDGGGGAVED